MSSNLKTAVLIKIDNRDTWEKVGSAGVTKATSQGKLRTEGMTRS